MALSIDRIDKPVTFWYEDYDGLMVPYERTDDYDNKWKSQHILHTNVIEETVGTYVPETWTFRFRKWLSCKLLKIP